MEQFVRELRAQAQRPLHAIQRCDASEMDKAYRAACLLSKMLDRLKEFTIAYRFPDPAAEIRFFREHKPRLLGEVIYYREVYHTELNRPPVGVQEQIEHLRGRQRQLAEYFEQNKDFYRYYRSGATHLDGQYFTRAGNAFAETIEDDLAHERDPRFSTPRDFMVAKILANDRLSLWLQEEIDRLEGNRNGRADSQKVRHTWTDKKINLVELLSAVVAHESINNGNVTMREATAYTEWMLNVDLSNIHRIFNELCIRHNPTQYLDQLREALLRKVEEVNGRAPRPKKK